MEKLMETRTAPSIRSGMRKHSFTISAAVIASLGAPATGLAALWESPAWALVGSADGSVGYDSNLYARSGGDGDGFAKIAPQVRLFRRSSLTKFEALADVQAVKYFTKEDEDSIDPSLSLIYSYPETEEALSSQEARALFSQSSSANADVGRRLRQTDAMLSWEGEVVPTGKSAFEGRARLRHTDYKEESYNTNQVAEAGVSYDFVSHARLRFGAGYDIGYGRSEPDSASANETESVSHAFTFRGRGDFLPKVSGRFYIGAVSIEYTGAQDRSDSDVIAGGAIVWAVHERLSVESKINRDIYFSPGGAVTTRSTVAFAANQQLIGGFSVTGEIEGSRAEHEQQNSLRRDHTVNLRTGIKYALTDRFSFSAACTLTNQESDEAFYDYDRALVSGHIFCRF